jgi:hypothetical protein
VQLAQSVEVNLLQKLPVSLDVDRRIPIPSWLIIVLPAKAAATPGSVVASTAAIVSSVASLLATATTTTTARKCTATTPRLAGTSLAAATGEYGASSISRLDGFSADNGKGVLVCLGNGGGEEGGTTGTINLLICAIVSRSAS